MPDPIAPDTKDWTWVLERSCVPCGYDATLVDLPDVGPAIRTNAAAWQAVLAGPRARVRRDPAVWSVTEYAAHVRDVHAVFAERLDLLLAEDEPVFADWDQDATARTARYDLATPEEVAPVLAARAAAVADAYDAVDPADRERVGHRSGGSTFTVLTLARYHLHDVVHHLWDVRRELTVAAYDARAAAYRSATPRAPEQVVAALDLLAVRVGPGGRVLEIGSGGGRDALLLEARGVAVRRTDITPGFVDLLRADGHAADVVDPLVDDLRDPARPGDPTPYDGVWANACLLHVDRHDLPVVLSRLAAVTRAGGALRLSLKEGDGEGWSSHGSIEVRRRFTYWRLAELTDVLTGAGWHVEATTRDPGGRGETWLGVLAGR
jgi:SAM-dependent methyltransferase